jgi:hypothetical protein
MTQPIADLKCEYRLVENRIHQFIMHKATREGMDEFVKWFAVAVDAHPKDQTLLILMDLRPEGIPPLGYALPLLRRFFDEHRHPILIRAAYLYRSSAIIGVVQAFLNTLHLKTSRRFFESEVEALNWLRTEGDQNTK